MEEKIREEFGKSWDIDYDQEKMEKKEKCFEMIKDLVQEIPQEKEELLDLVSEIKWLIKSAS